MTYHRGSIVLGASSGPLGPGRDAGSIPPGGCVKVSLSTKILVLDSLGLGLPPGEVVEVTVSAVQC